MQIPTMFKEADGKLSYSRIVPAIITVVCLAISVEIAVRTGTFADIPTNWAILAGGTFVGGKAVAKNP